MLNVIKIEDGKNVSVDDLTWNALYFNGLKCKVLLLFYH